MKLFHTFFLSFLFPSTQKKHPKHWPKPPRDDWVVPLPRMGCLWRSDGGEDINNMGQTYHHNYTKIWVKYNQYINYTIKKTNP